MIILVSEVSTIEAQNSHLIFYYPFSYRQHHFDQLQQTLKQNQYFHFQIEKMGYYDSLYGPDVEISQHVLKQFYYPFIEEKLLNNEASIVHFNRYSKMFELSGAMKTTFEEISFTIHSADINLCPFGIGILAIRIELHQIFDVTTALSFANYFRVLQPKVEDEMGNMCTINGLDFENTDQIIFTLLAPFISQYFVDYSFLGKNISKIPFFEDERMYVSAFLQVNDETKIDDELLYRAAQLNGRDQDGKPYTSSTNDHYINRFVKEHCYDRWSPDFNIMTTLQGQIHVTNYNNENIVRHISDFHSTFYYSLLIHYFYKLILLKLAFEHSELKFSKDKDIVEDLIEQITKFASRYYFSEVSVRTEGREISGFFRKVFRIEEQYREIKETLDELYRLQEDQSTERFNQLLFILTIFSMISGIYGMNLVIDILGKPLEWASILSFTLFEWIAFLLTILGLSIAVVLVFNQLYNLLSSYLEKKRRKRKQ